MSAQERHLYEFGPFCLDPAERVLWRNDNLVPLTPKAFETLMVLVSHSGHIVDKDELMKDVWPDAFVEEGGLARNISVLRKALGEGPNDHRYIETIPRRGYRFVAPVRKIPVRSSDLVVEKHTYARVVTEEEEELGAVGKAGSALSALQPRALLAATKWALSKRQTLYLTILLLFVAVSLVIALAVASYFYFPRAGKGSIDSIAVLPFANTNADPNTEYLSDGITESIISSLSQLPQLRVMARSTVFSYKGKDVDPRKVGRDLGVRAVLMGRVIQQGDNLTIRTELVNVADGTELWGQQYNRKLTDVFAVQEEIAKEISGKLRLKLSGAEQQQLAKRPTENLKAFQYYMQGRAYSQRRTREDLLTAISYCEKSLKEDSNYALAYAGLADAYAQLGVRGYIAPQEGRRKAEEAARKALALDENLAEAHAELGLAYVSFTTYNFSLGDRELRHAIELSRSLAMAHQYLGISLAHQGRFDEALEEFLKARELDPLSSIIARQVAVPYYLKRDYVRALELLRQANELGPTFSTTWEIGVYIQNGLFNETLAELEKAKRERKSDPILIYSTGMVYAAQGKQAEALQIIKELEEMSGASLDQAHWIAKIYATLNEKELALAWLERGLAAGTLGAFYKDEPVWDPIRSDARFAQLLRQMGSSQSGLTKKPINAKRPHWSPDGKRIAFDSNHDRHYQVFRDEIGWHRRHGAYPTRA